MTPTFVLVVNPDKEVGRVTLITRYGAEKVGQIFMRGVFFEFSHLLTVTR